LLPFLFFWGCGSGSSGTETVKKITITTSDGGNGGGGIAEDTTAPTVPTRVTATAVGSYKINLSWNPSSDNVGPVEYKVYRDGIIVATTANITYSDTGLAPDTEYCYDLAAFDVAGNVSVASEEVCATTEPEEKIWELGAKFNAQHITTTADGLYISGRYNGWERPFAAKVVDDGVVKWTTLLSGTSGLDNSTGIAEYAGNIYVSYFTDYFGRYGEYEEYIAILDGETGVITKTISVPTCGSTGYGPGLAVDVNGIYSAGLYCLQKIDSDGNVEWKKTPGVISSIKLDADGNIYVGGYADGPEGGYDLTANKYSPAGDQIWIAQWGTENLDMGGALVYSGSSGGTVYLAGAGVDENLKTLPVVVIKINAITGEVMGKTDFLATSSGIGGAALGPEGPVVAMGGRLVSSTLATEWNVPASGSFTADTVAVLDGVVYVAYENTIRRYDVDTGEEITY